MLSVRKPALSIRSAVTVRWGEGRYCDIGLAFDVIIPPSTCTLLHIIMHIIIIYAFVSHVHY